MLPVGEFVNCVANKRIVPMVRDRSVAALPRAAATRNRAGGGESSAY